VAKTLSHALVASNGPGELSGLRSGGILRRLGGVGPFRGRGL
jgi:hypothetical protein